MLAVLTLFWSSLAWGSPFPGTGSSQVVSHKPGLYYSINGFQLDRGKTAWVQSEGPKQIPSLVTIYKAPDNGRAEQAALTVRVDRLSRRQGLKSYVKRWMKDYSRFGFDVLTAKPVKVNSQSAFLLDIISRETAKQLRQVVFIKNRVAVILTCRDNRDQFSKSVQDCNEIIKTFQWTAKPPSTESQEDRY
ncbi:MAG: hypothetical protein AB7F86_09880 [Bdellovibrionales bacterium]